MNRAILIGHLGKDVEIKHTQGGKELISFSLATSSRWNDDRGQKQERTEWHRCTGWGDRWRGISPYLLKGTKIAVEGEVRYRDADIEGKRVVYTDIHVTHIELLGSKRDGEQQDRQMGPGPSDRDNGARQQKQMEFDDDIPF